MPAVSTEAGRWRLTDQNRYGGGLCRAGSGAGCEAGVIRDGQPAGTRGSGGSGVGGPIQTGACLGPDLLCQRRLRRVREGPGEEDGGGSGVRGAMGEEPAFPRVAGDKGGRPSC